MSYNCSTFKVKTLENLKIPITSFYKSEKEDWHPDRVDNDNGTVTFWLCESWIAGTVKDGLLHVHDINFTGEGSGCGISYILEPALSDSTGVLVACLVWEDGDSITRLTVKDGKVKWEDVIEEKMLMFVGVIVQIIEELAHS